MYLFYLRSWIKIIPCVIFDQNYVMNQHTISKSTTEERKILCLMAQSDETILSYSYIRDNAHLNSEPSALLKSLISKNMIIKPARGKYKLKNNLFKLYLQNLGINQN